ncbi:MAG: T9SS type A sorting domain-containing protein [Ignavibacteria bacterium]|jgi:hypothetical protein|nr:T9SS type A sorting domain-containing protein [Ignavibacteria bacterium]MCU7514205.1 T9SS type A sorting domain-containing protein [Ignavibacteria bacterium]
MNRILLKSIVFTVLFSACIQAQWVKAGINGRGAQDIAAKDSLLYAISQDDFFSSKDNGATWDSLSSFTAPEPQHILFLNDTIFVYGHWNIVADTVAEVKPCVLRSDDGGHTWKTILSGRMGIGSMTISGRTLFCPVGPKLILKSTNYGESWDTLSFTTPSYAQVDLLFSHNKTLYAAQFGNGLFKSSDEGLSWKDISGSLQLSGLPLIFANSKYVFLEEDGILYRSSDDGESWEKFEIPVEPRLSAYNALAADSLIFLTGFSKGTTKIKVYSANINGTEWRDITAGLPDGIILLPNALAVKENCLFLAAGSDLWKYDLTQLLASQLLAVENNPPAVNTYTLSQNYPNPFNPATTISYTIPRASHVELKVYDMLGREVQTLMSMEQAAGSYKVQFEASHLPSGMYIYEIRAGNFTKNGKMLLLK